MRPPPRDKVYWVTHSTHVPHTLINAFLVWWEEPRDGWNYLYNDGDDWAEGLWAKANEEWLGWWIISPNYSERPPICICAGCNASMMELDYLCKECRS